MMALVVAIAGMMLPAISVYINTIVGEGAVTILTLDVELAPRLNAEDVRPQVRARSHEVQGVYIILVEGEDCGRVADVRVGSGLLQAVAQPRQAVGEHSEVLLERPHGLVLGRDVAAGRGF